LGATKHAPQLKGATMPTIASLCPSPRDLKTRLRAYFGRETCPHCSKTYKADRSSILAVLFVYYSTAQIPAIFLWFWLAHWLGQIGGALLSALICAFFGEVLIILFARFQASR
jgi:hypothetical protein